MPGADPETRTSLREDRLLGRILSASAAVTAAVVLLARIAPALAFAAEGPADRPAVPGEALAAARSLLNEGRLNEAEQQVRRLLEAPPPSPDAHFLLAYVLFRQIQARAPQVGEGAAHAEPTRALARESLGHYAAGARYREPDAFDLKIAALDQALLGDYVAADGLLTRSVASNPKDADAWYYLGRTKYNENRFEDAVHAFARCLELEPRNVKAEDNLGLSYAGLGRDDEAAAAYEKAIAWQETVPQKNLGPFLDLGTLRMEQNRPQEAIPHLLQAVAISPRSARAHEQLGKAYLRLEQLLEAQAELEQAVQLAPENAPLHFVLGQVYRKRGQTEKARAEFDRASALNANRSTP
jgi:Flp pilus assembly protein TadD